ncbi:hypothetical protein OPU71_04595 [Niveibacterium sp. 24ML]|uniref:hypothetical protein n=1 Tax=Niveibacterium sp. 24ML TaxID=2985512 RepID=UPI00226D93DA|nr:hypothetical protein [Niveibacterium sp. 24ML]MCX9155397.1 hypothetical protein [Niveibacterium sp. 24ML]
MRHIRLRLLALLFAPLASLGDDTPPTDSAAQTVVVKGVRDPAMMPYRDAYEFANRIERVPHDKVRVKLQLRPRDKATRQADLRLRLAGENVEIAVPLSEDGEFAVPRSPEALADQAEFVTNQKRGNVSLAITLQPTLPIAPQIAYADALEAATQARALIKEIVPWYYRLLVADPNALRICFERADAQATLVSRYGDEALPIRGKRQCAILALNHDRLDDWLALRLTPPYSIEFSHRSWFKDGLDD